LPVSPARSCSSPSLFFFEFHWIRLRVKGNPLQARRLRPPHAQIEVLDGLAGSSLDQIVDDRQDNDPAGSFIQMDSQITVIAPLDLLRPRPIVFGTEADKGRRFIHPAVHLLQPAPGPSL